jgi:hypothetical protein
LDAQASFDDALAVLRQIAEQAVHEAARLACEKIDAELPQAIPMGNGLHGTSSDGSKNKDSSGDRMPGHETMRKGKKDAAQDRWDVSGA